MSREYYMAITDDKYELPIAVEESVAELAKILKLKETTIGMAISQERAIKRLNCKVIKIYMLREDD
jgi:SUMO ligase MMS21 Smc5/6 complex component